MTSRIAYVLEWDYRFLDSLKEIENYVWLKPFPGKENIVRLSSTAFLDVPEPVEFEAIFEYLQETTDYPPNNVNWPIMSRHMLDVVRSVGDFPHRQIDIRIHDASIGSATAIARRTRSRQIEDEYVAVQLLTHLDAMDMEKSDYSVYSQWPDEIQGIDKLVLKIPETGFPPLFRLAAKPIPLFVSSSARHVLEEAEVKGIAFQDVEDFRL